MGYFVIAKWEEIGHSQSNAKLLQSVFTVNICKEVDGLKGFCCFKAWGKCLEHLKKYGGNTECDA